MNILTRLVSGLVIFIFACSTPSPNEQETKVLKGFLSNYPMDVDTVNTVFVLSEEGCPKCNRSFALFVKQFVSTSNSVTIVSAKGLFLDVAAFENKKGIYFDYKADFLKTKLSNGSCVIFIEDKQVDTILQINVETLEKSMNYLTERLKHE